MRLVEPRLPDAFAQNWPSQITARLQQLFREIARVVNAGCFWDTEGTAAPTTGTWAQGNTCRNTSPVEAGTAGSKYVVVGWIYTPTGWLPMRTPTGN